MAISVENFPTRVFCTLLKWFPLELGTSTGVKKLVMGLPGWTRS